VTDKLIGPNYELEARSFLVDPTQEQLTELTAKMPNAAWTKYGNLNVKTRATARSTASTYIVTDTPSDHEGHQTIDRAEYERLTKLQEEYIRDQDMIVVNGFIGNDDGFKVPARLIIEARNANVAGSQDLLYFKDGSFTEPQVTVIYTPNLEIPGYPNNCCIAVDIENGVARNMNSDYFGESKKGGLRMWNKIVYDRGGIPLHAGCKVIPTENDGEKTLLIIGLSGTGKTTTTFTRQNDSKPVQDDFVALMPGGKVYGTENGCFAKTYGLAKEYEPTIYGAVVSPGSYLENVSQTDDGDLDFFDESFTANGRAVFAMEKLGWFEDARNVKPVSSLLILNRNTNIIPAVARLPREAAAAYFMLGETQGTSAGGAAEAGKALRVPGTNPFFPLPHALQGNRFFDVLATAPMDIYLMNTGWVGGDEDDEKAGKAKKVKIPISSAVVKGIADGTIAWERDPDFGYEIATSVPGIEDAEFLKPRLLYERQGRASEYDAVVAKLKHERAEYLAQYHGLKPEIVAAIK
jgi:phosphoenolpyruvate carboxykinase (ATP)